MMEPEKTVFCNLEMRHFPESEFREQMGYLIHQRGKDHWAESGDYVEPDNPVNVAEMAGPDEGEAHG